ncbi:ubiquinol-cytochrome-c reductase complex subunit 6 [Obba rivulosa]|uniref:Complex III subunit 7 n=1 Tax=Obba rivulosa TaxID=1052685 RepID=A0A8E2DTR2_9APHY|nr:ubiquinol-cytochrome-c reductase complex subunit 6 [Obba rivulosa]
MTILGPLGPSLAPAVRANKNLYRWVKPFADWYANLAGWRKVGLKYDDLRANSNSALQAIGRLTPREYYDRAFRYKRASHLSVLHTTLPKDQWTKPEEDKRYLAPHVRNVEAEDQERFKWDHMEVHRN